MLKHMRQSGVVDRPCQEGKVKHTVGIAVGDIHQVRACTVVLKQNGLRAKQREVPDFLNGEAFHRFSHGRQCARLFGKRARHYAAHHCQHQ